MRHLDAKDDPRGAPDRAAFRAQLARVAADRHSPEAAALYRVLFDYTVRRVRRSGSGARLSPAEQEEVVGDVLLQLMTGGLASFRGGTLPELLAFVRTIADRGVWRLARRQQRERQALDEAGPEGASAWSAPAPPGVESVEVVGQTPLSEVDQGYLLDLLRAGSKAEYARRAGVSRAAVTQRVKRIADRLAALDPQQRTAHQVWLEQAATATLASDG